MILEEFLFNTKVRRKQKKLSMTWAGALREYMTSLPPWSYKKELQPG